MAQKDKKKEAPPAPVVSVEDRDFEMEIARRNPKRKPKDIARFDFPSDIEDARAIYMFEMKAKDELAAAEMADTMMTDHERKSMQRTMEAEQREGIRLSIVGVILEDETGQLVRLHVDQAKPFMMMDDWSIKTLGAMRTFHRELNGVNTVALGNAVRSARRLGVATLPETPPQAATET